MRWDFQNRLIEMQKRTHPILENPHQYRLVSFSVQYNETSESESYIDLCLEKEGAIKKLRFFRAVDLVIDRDFTGCITGMEILDIRDQQ
jgi:hypothetical protein